VIDEHGGTAGVLTVEDLVEEVVGDIADEHDAPELTVIREAYSVVLVGSLHPDEVAEACGFEMPEGQYETLAGFALDVLQRIPNEGELFTYEGWRFEVVEMDRRRIASLRLTPPGVDGEAGR
jgi:CBS domain containing-hemolysin-like protein